MILQPKLTKMREYYISKMAKVKVIKPQPRVGPFQHLYPAIQNAQPMHEPVPGQVYNVPQLELTKVFGAIEAPL